MPSAYITEDAGSAVKKLFSIAKSIWRTDDNFRSAKAKVQRDNWNKYSSIARLSRDLIMSFPTVCSNVIDPKTATMINKAIERKNVTMIQMVAAAIHLQGYSGKDVISQLHTNMGINYNVDDYINNILAFQQMYKEAAVAEGPIPYNVYSEAILRQFQESLKHVYPVNSLSENSILDYEIRNGSQVLVAEAKGNRGGNRNNSNNNYWDKKLWPNATDEDKKAYINDLKNRFDINAANAEVAKNKKDADKFRRTYGKSEVNGFDMSSEFINPEAVKNAEDYETLMRAQSAGLKADKDQIELDRWKKEQERIKNGENPERGDSDYWTWMSAKQREKEFKSQEKMDKHRKRQDAANYKLNKDKFEYQKEKDILDREYQKDRDKVNDDFRTAQFKKDLMSDKHNYLKQQLLDTDVKKANELQPTLIVLRYQVADPKADSSNVLNYIPEEFVAGVKSRMIAVPSNEIIDRIVDMKKSGVSMANLVKATTKETSFTKDFLAGIEMAKIDAKKDSKLSKSNSIWRSLQARSNKSLLKRLTRSANNATAITTLVISSQEVELVKNVYNIDMSNPKVAMEFMSSYNLMGLAIVDEQTEVASFIYDGDAYFEDMSFTALEKENNSVSTKQIVNLLNNRR